MNKEQIIEFTDEWREENSFLGYNTEETELEDNELVYYLENPCEKGWVRQCYFVIPEDFYELSENEQKNFLNKKYEQELKEWKEDDEDFYKNIGFSSGLAEDNAEVVREIVSKYFDFKKAREYL